MDSSSEKGRTGLIANEMDCQDHAELLMPEESNRTRAMACPNRQVVTPLKDHLNATPSGAEFSNGTDTTLEIHDTRGQGSEQKSGHRLLNRSNYTMALQRTATLDFGWSNTHLGY